MEADWTSLRLAIPAAQEEAPGWHFTCADAACDSLVKLIEAMRSEAEPSRRSIALSQTTPSVWAVPNFGEPLRERHQTIMLEYDPNFGDLLLSEDESRLRLHFGNARASNLVETIIDLKAGGGDYALLSSDKDAPPIWIWWMLRSER